MSGTTGAKLSIGVVIILGLANLFADGISMGMGDYLSSHAELKYAEKERKREMWETENYIEGSFIFSDSSVTSNNSNNYSYRRRKDGNG